MEDKIKEEQPSLAHLLAGVRIETAVAIAIWVDEEVKKEATNFLVFCRRKAKSLESDPYEWGRFDRLCSDQKYDLYIQSLTTK